jgi:hypothetical protein
VKARRIVASAVRIASGAALVVAAVFWAGLAYRVVVGFVAGGADGARGNLHRLIVGSAPLGEVAWDPVAALSRGYEFLILCLLLTLGLAELYRWARKEKRGPIP